MLFLYITNITFQIRIITCLAAYHIVLFLFLIITVNVFIQFNYYKHHKCCYIVFTKDYFNSLIFQVNYYAAVIVRQKYINNFNIELINN